MHEVFVTGGYYHQRSFLTSSTYPTHLWSASADGSEAGLFAGLVLVVAMELAADFRKASQEQHRPAAWSWGQLGWGYLVKELSAGLFQNQQNSGFHYQGIQVLTKPKKQHELHFFTTRYNAHTDIQVHK